MDYIKNYNIWIKNVKDELLLQELKSYEGNETELINRFSKYLEFGTSGIRGIIGVGTNNINVYTISKTTQGISNYLKQNFKKPSVVIAYDNRKFSKEFATLTAQIFAKNKIKVHLFNELTPTPILSYTVRKLNATIGVNITSSHNSKFYNGYKVVNSAGAQIDSEQAKLIYKEISEVNEFIVKSLPIAEAIENNLVTMLDRSFVDEYISLAENYVYGDVKGSKNLNIVYTPLNGTGKYALLKTFSLFGFNSVIYPESQIDPDENFTTAPNPNPELKEVFNESLKIAKNNNADIIIATDPDCDRVGIMVKHNNNYVQLTGDQAGVLILDYILKNKQKNNLLNKNSFMVMTVVSSVLTEIIAKSYGVKVYKTLTGFKNIANKVEHEVNRLNLKNLNGSECFTFAYEEAIGYIASNNIRDKDGIIPSLIISLMANELKESNKTLIDYLNELYKKHGYIFNLNYHQEFEGIEGINKIQNAVNKMRNTPPVKIGKFKVESVIDYLNSRQTKLEKQNFLELVLSNNSKAIIRPSGTEPKLKVYLTSMAKNEKIAIKQLKHIQKNVNKILFK